MSKFLVISLILFSNVAFAKSMSQSECMKTASKFVEAQDLSFAQKMIFYCKEIELAEYEKKEPPPPPKEFNQKLRDLSSMTARALTIKQNPHQKFLDQFEEDESKLSSSEAFFKKYKTTCKNKMLQK